MPVAGIRTTLADISGHFAPFAAVPLAWDRGERYQCACDAADVVRTQARSRAAESRPNEVSLQLPLVLGSSSQERRQKATMNRRGTWILGAAACATVLGILIGFKLGPPRTSKARSPQPPQPLTTRIRRASSRPICSRSSTGSAARSTSSSSKLSPSFAHYRLRISPGNRQHCRAAAFRWYKRSASS
jgi:hypothetical protein